VLSQTSGLLRGTSRVLRLISALLSPNQRPAQPRPADMSVITSACMFNGVNLQLQASSETVCKFAWHPHSPRLLVIRDNGELGWMDGERFEKVGAIALEVMDVVSMSFLSDTVVGVASSERVDFWRLGPFERVGSVDSTSELTRLTGIPHLSLFALESLGALQFWTLDTGQRHVICQLSASIDVQNSRVCFSPSGAHFAVFDNVSALSTFMLQRQAIRVWRTN
jgi:hypothetical protein